MSESLRERDTLKLLALALSSEIGVGSSPPTTKTTTTTTSSFPQNQQGSILYADTNSMFIRANVHHQIKDGDGGGPSVCPDLHVHSNCCSICNDKYDMELMMSGDPIQKPPVPFDDCNTKDPRHECEDRENKLIWLSWDASKQELFTNLQSKFSLVTARDVELVMNQASIGVEKAILALSENNGDIVNAIMAFMED